MKIFLAAFFCVCLEALQHPTSFGLTTVTKARDQVNSQYTKYIERYATMDCDIISQINIVWNNPFPPPELNSIQVKRPVYFYVPRNNSMNERYRLAQNSKAMVYFSIDDDIITTCEELRHGFKIWSEIAVGHIGPLASYGPRTFYYLKSNQIVYGDSSRTKTGKELFALSLIGLCFVSRHFLELYYAEEYYISQMREIVKRKNNCDDIALNFIVKHFYSELRSIVIKGNVLNISPKIAQSYRKDHLPFRSQCVFEFMKILGYNPLTFQFIQNPSTIPNIMKQETVLIKYSYILRNILKKTIENQSLSSPNIKKYKNENSIAPIKQTKSQNRNSSNNFLLIQRSSLTVKKIQSPLNKEEIFNYFCKTMLICCIIYIIWLKRYKQKRDVKNKTMFDSLQIQIERFK